MGQIFLDINNNWFEAKYYGLYMLPNFKYCTQRYTCWYFDFMHIFLLSDEYVLVSIEKLNPTEYGTCS